MSENTPWHQAKHLAGQGQSFDQIREALMKRGLSDGEASMLARTVTEKVEEPVKPPPKELSVVPADMQPETAVPPSQLNINVIFGIVLFIAGVLMGVSTTSPISFIPVGAGVFFLVKGFRSFKEMRAEMMPMRTPDCSVHRGVEGAGHCPSCSVPLCKSCAARAVDRGFCPLCEK